jgi:hypothetical protein
MRAGLRIAAALSAVSTALQAQAASFDIRDCRLDLVTFVEPWAGASFAVKRVGTRHTWLCPEGKTAEGGGCDGPFGDLVLEGVFTPSNGTPPRTMTATRTVLKALPCCSWSVEEGPSSLVGKAGFKWLERVDVPALRTLSSLSIEAGDYGSDFGVAVHAAICDLP